MFLPCTSGNINTTMTAAPPSNDAEKPRPCAPQKEVAASGAQVVIVPIVKKDDEREAVLAAARALQDAAESAGLRARLDADEGRTPGWKFHFWEMKVLAILGAVHTEHRHPHDERQQLVAATCVTKVSVFCFMHPHEQCS